MKPLAIDCPVMITRPIDMNQAICLPINNINVIKNKSVYKCTKCTNVMSKDHVYNVLDYHQLIPRFCKEQYMLPNCIVLIDLLCIVLNYYVLITING